MAVDEWERDMQKSLVRGCTAFHAVARTSCSPTVSSTAASVSAISAGLAWLESQAIWGAGGTRQTAASWGEAARDWCACRGCWGGVPSYAAVAVVVCQVMQRLLWWCAE